MILEMAFEMRKARRSLGTMAGGRFRGLRMLRFALVAFGAMAISLLEGVVVATWLVYAARQLDFSLI